MNIERLIPDVERAALALYAKVTADEKQAQEKVWHAKYPDKPLSRWTAWSIEDLNETTKYETFEPDRDPDFQFIHGIAMACDAHRDDSLMHELWEHFHSNGPDDARVACQWAFEGCAGWHA